MSNQVLIYELTKSLYRLSIRQMDLEKQLEYAKKSGINHNLDEVNKELEEINQELKRIRNELLALGGRN